MSFEEMTILQKCDHIEKCCKDAEKEIVGEGIVLADVIDVFDYWIPWLLNEVKNGVEF